MTFQLASSSFGRRPEFPLRRTFNKSLRIAQGYTWIPAFADYCPGKRESPKGKPAHNPMHDFCLHIRATDSSSQRKLAYSNIRVITSTRIPQALRTSVTAVAFTARFSNHARIGGVTIAVSSDIATMIAYI